MGKYKCKENVYIGHCQIPICIKDEVYELYKTDDKKKYVLNKDEERVVFSNYQFKKYFTKELN